MWVCHCAAVTDTHVREAIAGGAADETQIGAHCGAGTGCGGCHEELRRLCDEARRCAGAQRSLVGISA
jgi:bacterioferritin-associated ferredoxin